jgi:hypothetical protein
MINNIAVNYCRQFQSTDKKIPHLFIVGFINSYQVFFEASFAGRKSVKTAGSNYKEFGFYVCN